MLRAITEDLLRWKLMKDCKPLLVRGARRVGKSWAIEQFGRDQFDDLIVLNFELYPKYSACFANPDPRMIIPSIELLTGKQVSSGTGSRRPARHASALHAAGGHARSAERVLRRPGPPI